MESWSKGILNRAMEIKIIPAILAYTEEELKEKMEKVDTLVSRVQIDVVEAIFNDKITVDLGILEEISTALVLDAQLMVKDAMQYIKSCEAAGVDRIVAQVEHLNNKEEFIERASAVGMQVGLALDLQTPVAELEKQIHNLDVILLMSVLAGRSGQKFNPGVVEKIKAVRRLRADVPICVDGGIRPENIAACAAAGAEEFAVGSFLWESGDIKKAIVELKEAAG